MVQFGGVLRSVACDSKKLMTVGMCTVFHLLHVTPSAESNPTNAVSFPVRNVIKKPFPVI